MHIDGLTLFIDSIAPLFHDTKEECTYMEVVQQDK